MTRQEASKVLRAIQSVAKVDGTAGDQSAIASYLLIESVLCFETDDDVVVEMATTLKAEAPEMFPS